MDDHKHLTEVSKLSLKALVTRGRSDEKLYQAFYTRFVRCITGKSKFKDRLQMARSEQEMSTVSDEAFALLLLENSQDRWLDIYKSENGKVHTKRNQLKRQWESDVPTAFTDGGIKYNEGQKKKKKKGFKGWNEAGILRFNVLFDAVKSDRRKHPDFIYTYLTMMREKTEETKPRSISPKTVRTDARNELGGTSNDVVASDDSSTDNEED